MVRKWEARTDGSGAGGPGVLTATSVTAPHQRATANLFSISDPEVRSGDRGSARRERPDPAPVGEQRPRSRRPTVLDRSACLREASELSGTGTHRGRPKPAAWERLAVLDYGSNPHRLGRRPGFRRYSRGGIGRGGEPTPEHAAGCGRTGTCLTGLKNHPRNGSI